MNTVETFTNETLGAVRTMVIDGKPYFVGKDVAKILGYAKPLNAIAVHVDEDDSLKQGLIDSMGRSQKTIFINESGVYSLIFSSKLPSAKIFKRWVTNEVLPSIRKNGGYIDGQEFVPAEVKTKLEAEIRELNAMISGYRKQVRDSQSKIDYLARTIERDTTGDFDKLPKDPMDKLDIYDLDVEGYDEFQANMEMFNFSDYSLMREITTIINSAKSDYIDKAAAKFLISEVNRLFVNRNAM